MSLWEVKDVFNKVKNAVLNLTEMEAKVREATNNDPWGASSTLMQEIAQGTHNYQQCNEIMPFIYRRLKEKEPHEWRQIYKSLTLLEYLVKNGSERVIDDCRSRLSLIKSMRSFNFIDDDGKDQGINVKNRAKELVKLLMDEDLIRSERSKAKTNRNKYRGMSSNTSFMSSSFSSNIGSSSSSRYQGFGSDSSPGVSSSSTRRTERNNEETASSKRSSGSTTGARINKEVEAAKKKQDANDKAQVGEGKSTTQTSGGATVDLLLDFGDEQASSSGITTTTTTTNINTDTSAADDWGAFQSDGGDDGFTDFQTASTTTATTTTSGQADLFGSLGSLGAFSAPLSTTTTTANNNHNNNSLFDAPIMPLSNAYGTPHAPTGMATTTTTTTIANTTTTATANSNQGGLGSLMNNSQPSTNTKKPALDVNDFWSANSPLVALDSLGSQPPKTTVETGPPLAALARQQQQQRQQQSFYGGAIGNPTTTTTTTTHGTSTSGWDSLI